MTNESYKYDIILFQEQFLEYPICKISMNPIILYKFFVLSSLRSQLIHEGGGGNTDIKQLPIDGIDDLYQVSSVEVG